MPWNETRKRVGIGVGKNGSIFARKAEKSPIVAIITEIDIEKICADDAAHIAAHVAQKSRVVPSASESDSQSNGAQNRA